jgi:hypothetical protein
MRFKQSITGLGVTLLLAGCAVHTPEVTFTGERTALEGQILGSYRTIEEDVWNLSSVRKPIGVEELSDDYRWEAIEAFGHRRFNADALADLERAEVIGENARGFLTIRTEAMFPGDSEYQALAYRIMQEENRDRQTILGHLVKQNSLTGFFDPAFVEKNFTQLMLDGSAPKTWIQKPDSSWSRK